MIIDDKMDPSGMYSKAGRLSTEMFTQLQDKEYILFGKKSSSKFDDFM